MTFARTMRSMPAMPIADSSPPIVVGIRHTSSATSTTIDTVAPAPAAVTANAENGASVAVASRNTSVSIASRIDSAISFGVRPRFAPSTIAIIRSRNESPGLLVTRTTSQSESTRVPPVTEVKSPPASRSTGADSPVTALSSTDATPSTASPSAGIVSLRLDQHQIVDAQRARRRPCHSRPRGPAHVSLRGPGAASSARRPTAPCRVARRRSAKFANSTVSHSHAAIASTKPGWPASSPIRRRSDPTLSSACCRRRRRTSPDCDLHARIELPEGIAGCPRRRSDRS